MTDQFCSRCGIHRLSVADISGVCLFCADGTLTFPVSVLDTTSRRHRVPVNAAGVRECRCGRPIENPRLTDCNRCRNQARIRRQWRVEGETL